jgi:hypothetical protein
VISRRQYLQLVAGAGVTAMWRSRAYAAVYLDAVEAQKLLLPQAASFVPLPLDLDEAALAEIAAVTQTRVPRGYSPRCWTGMAGFKSVGWVLADRVIGKYELIDYAAGFSADGATLGVEILAYRESHGSEIRNAAWRRQFLGRKGPSQLRFGDDIRNISGATLSCEHVTQGVQRLSAIVQRLVAAGSRG